MAQTLVPIQVPGAGAEGLMAHPFLSVTEALESGAPMAAGLHSSLLSRGREGSPRMEKRLMLCPLHTALPSPCLPCTLHWGTCPCS